VAQGEILESELAVAAAQDGEESKQVEQEDDHRARIVSGSKLTDQPPDRRTGFWPRIGWERIIVSAILNQDTALTACG